MDVYALALQLLKAWNFHGLVLCFELSESRSDMHEKTSSPDTSAEAVARRKRASEQSLAANILAGYVIDPHHEADMERYVAGAVTLDQLREETIARYRQPQEGRQDP